MYESFFDFNSRPFAAAPLVENYYPAESIEHARQTLLRIVERAEGPGIVVGQAGLGKSLLCRLVAEYFRDSFDVVILSSARIGTRKSLLQSILFELRLPYLEFEEGELRLGLLDFLQPGNSSPNGMLLLVDEAHNLPMRLLDEIRMITNLVREGRPRARLIMAGGPQLEERFAHPNLASFNQRLAARCYLDNFGREDTFRYVHSQVRAVGGDPTALFTEGGLEAVHRASDGIPRLINQICDHALVLGCAGGRRHIDQFGIEEAWADLQQLPGPWSEPMPTSEASEVVEFGELDEYVPVQTTPSTEADRDLVIQDFDDDIESPAVELDISTGMHLTPPEEDFEMDLDMPADDLLASPAPEEDLPLAASGAVSEQFVSFGASEFESLSINCLEINDPTAAETPTDAASELPELSGQQTTEVDHSDPFGTGFVEEEVVIDRTTALAIEAFRGRPTVSSPEGRELASLLDEIDISPLDEILPDSNIELSLVETFDGASVHSVSEKLAASDDPLTRFEHTVYKSLDEFDLASASEPPVELFAEDLSGESIIDEAEFTCVAFPETTVPTDDDREMMIIRRDRCPEEGSESAALVKRVEYQELFAQLRKA